MKTMDLLKNKRVILLIVMSIILIFSMIALLSKTDFKTKNNTNTDDTLRVNAKEINIKVGESYPLNVNNLKVNEQVEWVSNDLNIASINEGLVTGVDIGTTRINVKTNLNRSTTITVNVTKNDSITSIKLSDENVTIKIGESLPLTLAITPTDALKNSLSWFSDNEKVATVINGVVTGIAPGTAMIIVRANNLSSSLVITVKE